MQAPGVQGLDGALLPPGGSALDQLLSGSLKNMGLSTNLLSSSQPEIGLEVNRPVADGHGQRCSERGPLPLQSQAGRQGDPTKHISTPHRCLTKMHPGSVSVEGSTGPA